MQLSQLTQKELLNHANCQSELSELETALLGLLEDSPSEQLEEDLESVEQRNTELEIKAQEMFEAMDKIAGIAAECL